MTQLLRACGAVALCATTVAAAPAASSDGGSQAQAPKTAELPPSAEAEASSDTEAERTEPWDVGEPANGKYERHAGMAQPVRADETPVAASVRASVGVGGGDLGFGGRVALGFEYWLTDAFAAGLVAISAKQTSQSLTGLGDHTNGSSFILAPVVGVRSSSSGGHFFGTLGIGYATVTRTAVRTYFGSGDLRQTEDYAGYGFTSALGWLHVTAGGFEIGPVARFEAMDGFHANELGAYLVTLNLEIGAAVRRR